MPATGGAAGDEASDPSRHSRRSGDAVRRYVLRRSFNCTRRWDITSSFPIRPAAPGTATHSKRRSRSNYGDAMFQDVQAVMDAAVRRPDVDATRLGVLGGSYGGYATLWVIAHTDRYKVAVAERAVSNLQSENLAADFAGEERPRRRLLHVGTAVGSRKHRLRQVLAADVRRKRAYAGHDSSRRRRYARADRPDAPGVHVAENPRSNRRIRRGSQTKTTTSRAPARRSIESSACT